MERYLLKIINYYYYFDSDPRFPPFVLYVRWKSGVTFVQRCFHDENLKNNRSLLIKTAEDEQIFLFAIIFRPSIIMILHGISRIYRLRQEFCWHHTSLGFLETAHSECNTGEKMPII